jgi:putative membrane protein
MKKSDFLKPLRNLTIAASLITLFSACTTMSPTPKGDLSDANIAAIVVGANNIDISAGKIALERSNNKKIKEFASRMITDHNAVLSSAVDLVTKLGVTPVNNALVATLSEQSKNHEAKLKTLSGDKFDMAYIDHEIAYHKAVIDVIEDMLIPGAYNQELKDALIAVVPAFKAHLAHSKMVKESL